MTRSKNILLAIGAVLLTVLIYYPFIFSAGITNPDAQIILPVLDSYRSLSQYFNDLFTFRTYDFQPVRDLSLLFDLKMYHLTGLNLTGTQNVLIWLAIVYQVRKIGFRYTTPGNQLDLNLLCLGFLVYPLFSQTVVWGIARKHLLSALFILLATSFKLTSPRPDWKKSSLINLFYTLSILSLPITILWPLWCASHEWLKEKKSITDSFLSHWGKLLILGLVGSINFLYYRFSPTFLSTFPAKIDNSEVFADKLLAVGHYASQIIFPHRLALSYTLGDPSVFLGLIITVIFIFYLYKKKSREELHWIVFALLPLCVVLVKSTIIYDTYLLVPVCGFFLYLCTQVQMPFKNYSRAALMGLVLVFSLLSHQNVLGWVSDVELARRSFENRKTCTGAIVFLRLNYSKGKLLSTNLARRYLLDHECLDSSVPPKVRMNIESNMMYYEDDIPHSLKLEKLKKFSEIDFYSSMVRTAYLIKSGHASEAEEALNDLVTRWGNISFRREQIKLVSDVIYPFCRTQAHESCLVFLRKFATKGPEIFYR